MEKKSFLLVALLVLTGFFAQAQSYRRTISVEFNQAPTSFKIDVAKLKFNKEFAYSLTIDDGYIDVWNVAYPLIQGNAVLETDIYQGNNYGSGMPFQKTGGYAFDDGCGHQIPFHLGLAINASQVAKNASRLNWWHLSTLYDAGWDILNHGHFHVEAPPIDFQDEIVQNALDIQSHIGFYPRHFAIPANQPAYAPETVTHGMVATYGAVMGFQGVYNGGLWNVKDDVSPVNNNQLKLLRTSVPVDSASMNLDALKTKINSIANMAPNQTIWYNEYTHAVGAGTNQYPNVSNMGFQMLRDYLDFLQQDYSQKMWVAGLQEVEEYLYVRQNAVITNQSLSGNILTFDVTLSDNQPDQRHFDLSLLVDGVDASISNITVQGDGYSTTNASTGLINFALVPEVCHDYVIGSDLYFDVNAMPGPYGKITVQSGATLNITPGSELSFCENGELIVEPGASVNFLGVLTSSSHWKGVHLLKNTTQSGHFRSYQGALIERADFGILADIFDGFNSEEIPVVCERTTFRDNHQAMNFTTLNGAFYQCNFINTSNFSNPLGFSAFAQLTNIFSPGVRFSNCRFIESRDGLTLTNNGILSSYAFIIVE